MSSADSSKNPTPKLSSKSTKTIDLGAAANYGKSEILHVDSSAQPPKASTNDARTPQAGSADLVDFLLGPSDSFQAPVPPSAPTQNDDFFADFASAPSEGGSISGLQNSSGKKHPDSFIPHG